MVRKFSSHYVNLIASGAYFGLLLVGVFLGNSAAWLDLVKIATVIALLAFAFNYWRYLAIAEAAVSTIAGAAQGYVELNGIASTEPALKSPLHNIPCVWYRSWVYARDGSQIWRLLDYFQSDAHIQLHDGTGKCALDANGAEVVYFQKHTSNHNGHRYVEEYLLSGRPLYVLGHLDTRHYIQSAKAIYSDVGKLVSQWRADHPRFMLRFDLDRNGELDMHEWEQARQSARQEVSARQQNLAHLGDFVLSAPADGQLYIISGLSPQDLRASYRCWVLTHLAVLAGLIFVLMQLS